MKFHTLVFKENMCNFVVIVCSFTHELRQANITKIRDAKKEDGLFWYETKTFDVKSRDREEQRILISGFKNNTSV